MNNNLTRLLYRMLQEFGVLPPQTPTNQQPTPVPTETRHEPAPDPYAETIDIEYAIQYDDGTFNETDDGYIEFFDDYNTALLEVGRLCREQALTGEPMAGAQIVQRALTPFTLDDPMQRFARQLTAFLDIHGMGQ